MLFYIIVACELTLLASFDFNLLKTVNTVTTVDTITSSYNFVVLCKAVLD